MPKSKTGSQSPLGVDAVINGELHHFVFLQLEYPQKPNERLADLAPGMPGFYTISARARAKTIRWMEACFANGSMTIEIVRRSPIVVSYSEPVDSVSEIPAPRLQDRLTGRLSAFFGFYRARVMPKEARSGSKRISLVVY